MVFAKTVTGLWVRRGFKPLHSATHASAGDDLDGVAVLEDVVAADALAVEAR